MAKTKHRKDSPKRDTDALETPDEQGRAVSIDPSPEGRLMQVDTIDTPDVEPLSPEGERERGEAIDDRAARDARMTVRKREHSAD